MHDPDSPPSVVVGIDGSRAAVSAALWAVDEAVSRDIPLRLVYAIDPGDETHEHYQDAARDLATAETAIRYAMMAVESTEKPVKIEVEILQGQPTNALLHASRSAAMISVGSMGFKHATQGRIGSTAAALAATAHCPVAIIRGHDPGRRNPGWVIVELDDSAMDDSASTGALQHGLDEARLRGAPLRVLITWQSRFTDVHDARGVAEGNRMAKAQLECRLAQWRRRYPDLDIQTVAAHCNTLRYLAKNAGAIQLVVGGRQRSGGLTDFVEASGHAALHDTDCSVLICEPQGRL